MKIKFLTLKITFKDKVKGNQFTKPSFLQKSDENRGIEYADISIKSDGITVEIPVLNNSSNDMKFKKEANR